MTPSQGELIHAEDAWGSHRRAGGAPDHPHEGVPTDEEAERLAQPHPSRPPEREANGEEACRQPQGPPRPGDHKAGQSLGEDAAWALPIGAEQLADAKLPRHPVATPREIGQRPGIMTVDMPGRDITARASGLCLCGRDQQGDLGVHFVDVPGVQLERCGLGQDMGKRVSNLHGSSGAHSSVSSFISIHQGRRGERPH
jgi:hypothetical protein